jgi:hypothetical protein
VLAGRLDSEQGNVGLGEVAGGRPSVNAGGHELAHPLGHPHRVTIAGNDTRARLAERQGDRIANLPRPAYASNEDDFACEVGC